MTLVKSAADNNATTLTDTKACQIIMVASGKGGVGKTWFSISFAQALAEHQKKVLIFDGDLGLANVDIQLGLMPSKDLGNVFAGQNRMEDVMIRYAPANIDIIPGRSGCASLVSLSLQQFTQLRDDLKRLSGQYDCVIIDLGSGVGGTVQNLSQLADSCILVLTDEPTSLMDAYAFIKLIHHHRPQLSIKIVVNQVSTMNEGQRIYDTLRKVCENFLHFSPKFAGAIRSDKRVREAIRHQTSLLTRHNDAPAAQDVRKIIKDYNWV